MRSICLLFILLYTSVPLQAQKKEYQFRKFSVDDGLLSTTVYCALQDKKGFIWFGTEGGVNRFDGHNFKKYTLDNGLEDNEITRIFEDTKGRLWFLTINGKLCYYQEGVFYNSSNTPWLKKTHLGSNYVAAYEDSRGNLWFNTNNHGALQITPDQEVIHFKNPEPFGKDFYMLTYETLDSSIFLIGFTSFKKVYGSSSIQLKTSLNTDNIKFSIARRGHAYLLARNSILELNDTVLSTCIDFSKTDLKWSDITRISPLKDGRILLSSYKGAFILNNSGSTPKLESFFPDKIILDVMDDSEGNLWFTIAGSGIYMLPNKTERWTHFTKEEGLNSDEVLSIAGDEKTGIWLGGKDGIITRLENDKVGHKIQLYDASFAYNRVRQIFKDKNDSVWAAYDNGIALVKVDQTKTLLRIPIRLNPVKNDERNYPQYVEQFAAKCINPDSSGNIYITYSFGVVGPVVMDENAVLSLTSDSSRMGLRTFYHCFDNKNRLWTSTINGLHCELTPGKPVKINGLNNVLRNRIIYITNLDENRMIIGGDGDGLYIARDTVLTHHLTTSDGLPSNVCRKIVVNKRGIFVCTNSGVAQIVEEADSLKVIRIFNIQNGLLSNDVFDLMLSGEHIWIATVAGLSRTSLNEKEEQKLRLPLYFESFYADGNYYKLEDQINLSPGVHQIAIRFVAIAYQNPKSLIYEYALADKDTIWHTTKLATVEFSDLPSGDYTFLLRARSENEDWSPTQVLNFTIRPFFWATIWFRTIAVTIILLVMYLIIRRFTSAKLKQQLEALKAREALESERMRIATDMHDDIGSDLSKISILSNVVLRQPGLKTEIPQITRISALSAGVLKKMDEIIWALNPSHDHLSGFISYLRAFSLESSESGQVNILFRPQPGIPDFYLGSSVRRVVYLIIKEAVNNATKHSGTTEVIISLDIQQSQLYIQVADQGSGIQPPAGVRKGMGLLSMHKRAMEIGGTLTIDFNEGVGTTLKLILPTKL